MAITKDFIANILIASEKFSNFSHSKLMRLTKDKLLDMSEEIGLKLREQQSIQKKTTKDKMSSKSPKVGKALVDFSLSGALDLPIGSTFSRTHYEEFKKLKSKDIFEQVIDTVMIDCIFNDDFTFKEVLYIKGTEEHSSKAEEIKAKILDPANIGSKRLVINKLLNSSNPFYGRIVDICRSAKSKREYIIQLNYILKEYLGIHKGEKAIEFQKSMGEVTTPLELVEEMLDTLPKEVWSNPNLKWLDPANGVGPFPCVIILRLMEGLAEWQPDEELLYKYIVEEMLYVCELQPINMFLYLFTIDSRNIYDTNIYCGSFLDPNFDFHMKHVWNIEKFDIIVGNPPYQGFNIKGSKQPKNHSSWTKFVEKAPLILKNYLLFVTPDSWRSISSKIFLLFKKNSLLFVDTNNIAKYFKGVNSTFGVFLFKMGKTEDLVLINGTKHNIDDITYIPNEGDLSLSIHKKTVMSKNDKYEFLCDTTSNHSSSSKQYLSKEKTDKNIYEVYHTNAQTLWSEKMSKNHNDKKVYFTISGYFNPKYGENISTSEICQYFLVDNEEAGLNLINILNSKLYKFLVNTAKWSGYLNKDIIRGLPKLDIHKIWTDEEIYSVFNLSQEEVNIIESYN